MIEFLDTAWGPMEPLVSLAAVGLAIYYFFADRPRRMTALGYIPTVVCLVFDKFERRILIAKVRETDEVWILPQGRIKGDIIDSADHVLSNELALERGFTFFDPTFLGSLPIRAKYRLKRYKDPREFRLWPNWRGKAYFGLPVEVPLAAAQAQIVVDHYREVRFVSVDEARGLLKQSHDNSKLQMYLQLLDQVEANNFYLDSEE